MPGGDDSRKQVPDAQPSQPPSSLVKAPPLTRKLVGSNSYTRWAGLQRGMLVWADVTEKEAREGEQVHKGSTLYVVVSNDRIHQRTPSVQVVPLSTSMTQAGPEDSEFRQYRIRILRDHITRFDRTNPLKDTEMLALTDQARMMAQVRLDPVPAGKLSKVAMQSIETGLLYVFNLLLEPPDAK